MNKKTIAFMLLAVVLAAALVFALSMGAAKKDQTEPAVNAQETGAVSEGAEATPVLQEAAEGEEALAEAFELTGTVVEVTDDYIVLETEQFGQVQANMMEDTLMEGAETIEAGQAVVVIYDGKMTRSLPAQITALLIRVHAVEGVVTAVQEGMITVERTDTGEEVVLTLPQDAQAPAVGETVVAYTNGISTMSLPPQMNAISIQTK